MAAAGGSSGTGLLPSGAATPAAPEPVTPPGAPQAVDPKPEAAPPPASCAAAFVRATSAYCARWRGVPGHRRPARARNSAIAVAFVGCFVSLAALGALNFELLGARGESLQMLTASFGASAALLYGAPASPLSQPRNLLAGHVLSAVVGVAVRILIVERACADTGHECTWLGAALAVALAVALMMATGTLHPPGGGTALAAVTGDATVRAAGFLFVVVPVAAGAALMLIVALVINNTHPPVRYPLSWW